MSTPHRILRTPIVSACGVVAATVSALLVPPAAAARPGTPAAEPHWNPCDGVATATVPKLNESALDTFGPLASQPSLTIHLPQVLSGTAPAEPLVELARIGGGVLVGLRADSGATGSVLAAVNADGNVRWTRCIEQTLWRAFASPTGTSAVLLTDTPGHPGEPGRVVSIDLADGTVSADLTPAIRKVTGTVSYAADTRGGVFFGPADSEKLAADAELARVDLGTMHVDSRPVPPIAVGGRSLDVRYEATASGYLAAIKAGSPSRYAVLDQGTWTTEPARVTKLYGPIIGFDPTATPPALTRWAPDGSVIWTRTDLHDPSREGFIIAATGTVTLVDACVSGAPPNCTEATLAINAADGTTIWKRDAVIGVVDVAPNGVALVSDDRGTFTIDIATGKEQEPGTRLPNSFLNECCGEGDYVHTARFGGVIAAVDHRVVQIWYPKGVAPKPQDVSLP